MPSRAARRAVLSLPLALLAAPARAERDLPREMVGALDRLFGGPHPGLRAAHAEGIVAEGVFHPAPGARALSRAPHLAGPPVPVLARFSHFAAVPGLPSGHPAAGPRGLALRFGLPGGADTDLVAFSYDGSPAGTPEAFLDFLRALPDPEALAALTADSPAARAFVEHPRPAPESYATERYFGVSAFVFLAADGTSRPGRYRIEPLAGARHLRPEEAAARPPDYLAEELHARLARAPALFRLAVQLAGEGDDVSDGSVPWPESRPRVALGTLALNTLPPPDDPRLAGLAFVPTNLPDGIAPSSDPMLLARTRAYRISLDRRTGESP